MKKNAESSPWKATPKAVFDAYHEILGPLNTPAGGVMQHIWAKDLERAIKARFNDAPHATDIRWWHYQFHCISLSPFLMGFVRPQGGFRPFKLSLDFLCKPGNLRRIREGAYHQQSLSRSDAHWVPKAEAECDRILAIFRPDLQQKKLIG